MAHIHKLSCRGLPIFYSDLIADLEVQDGESVEGHF